MPKLTIVINENGEKYTVSEMRRRLAQILSKLNGGQKCSFTFRATLENYVHVPEVPPTVVMGEYARPSNE